MSACRCEGWFGMNPVMCCEMISGTGAGHLSSKLVRLPLMVSSLWLRQGAATTLRCDLPRNISLTASIPHLGCVFALYWMPTITLLRCLFCLNRKTWKPVWQLARAMDFKSILAAPLMVLALIQALCQFP